MGFNDEPMIKQKEYTAEEYKVQKRKSIRVAKRTIIMSELTLICLTNLFVSLGLFLLLMLGTSAIPYFCDFQIEYTQENFCLRGGYFLTIIMVFLILLPIFGFWYAIAYKRLEIMCIHLDGELNGVAEVTEAAQRDNTMNNIGKLTGVSSANYNSIGEAARVTFNYLKENDTSAINEKIFTFINTLIILCQVILALICVLLLIK